MKNLIEEYDLILAGTQYDNKYYNSEGSRKGSKFDLEIEIDNPVDPLAISVKFNGKSIGYIPRDENLEIAYYLSYPKWFSVDCRQKKKIDNDRNYETIVVIVYIYVVSENYVPFSFDIFDKEFPDYDKEVEKRNLRIEFEKKQKEQRKADRAAELKERKELEKEKENKEAFKGCLMIIIFFIIGWFLWKACQD